MINWMTWVMEYNALSISTETSQVGFVLFVSKRSLASLFPLLFLSLSVLLPLPHSSPSFRSDIAATVTTSVFATATETETATASAAASSSLNLSVRPTLIQKNLNNSGSDCHYHDPYYTRRARIPFLLAKKKKKKAMVNSAAAATKDIVFKRSKSTTTPKKSQFLDDADEDDIVIEDFSPSKRNGFWSFLYFSSKSSASGKKIDKRFKDNSSRTSTLNNGATSTGSTGKQQKDKHLVDNNKSADTVEEDDSPNSQATASASSFERKVSRSRSVGCGSRSFSGDFFERISTGFGDCTLRRVDSQREGRSKVASVHRSGEHHHRNHHNYMKERVRCGGIFSGFMMTSSSSSSSWVSSSADDDHHHQHQNTKGKSTAAALSHSRANSWAWALASPMRAFSGSKPSIEHSKRGIIRNVSDKNVTPDLAAIPSLLAVEDLNERKKEN
ncbi:Vitellogenin-like protein [Quillaja saponaria]|uniref:Vitellogenin-like protein n=1 Tax=Quillaja saponaria TaxID=32244 RepID=A0AAD7PHM9_QUISA|nr:Vitellogenin-like protein [Quillaja saponaria]